MHEIHLADNLAVLRAMPDGCADLIYIDPPFNTGRPQTRTRLVATHSPSGDRLGFQGRRYLTREVGRQAFADAFDDYLAFLEPRLREAHRVLARHGTLYFHIDYREAHYCKVLLDGIFGRAAFLNEIIWAYDYGGKTTRRWPPKHDTILVYVKDTGAYRFNADAVERIPYMAPGLVGPEKAARGKRPTDTWWHTIVPTAGGEKTGYPTQKPLGILRRIVAASSNPGDTVLDFFAGSGTAGAAAHALGRRFILVDNNPEAVRTMARRFRGVPDIRWWGFNPAEPWTGPGAGPWAGPAAGAGVEPEAGARRRTKAAARPEVGARARPGTAAGPPPPAAPDGTPPSERAHTAGPGPDRPEPPRRSTPPPPEGAPPWPS